MGDEEERVMARQHAGTAVINEGHKEVVNIRTAGALFCTPLLTSMCVCVCAC